MLTNTLLHLYVVSIFSDAEVSFYKYNKISSFDSTTESYQQYLLLLITISCVVVTSTAGNQVRDVVECYKKIMEDPGS